MLCETINKLQKFQRVTTINHNYNLHQWKSGRKLRRRSFNRSLIFSFKYQLSRRQQVICYHVPPITFLFYYAINKTAWKEGITIRCVLICHMELFPCWFFGSFNLSISLGLQITFGKQCSDWGVISTIKGWL